MSQTLSASTLIWVPMAPLVGSVLAGVLGTKFGGNRMGRAGSHTLTILGVFDRLRPFGHDAPERCARRRAFQ